MNARFIALLLIAGLQNACWMAYFGWQGMLIGLPIAFLLGFFHKELT